MKNSCPNLNNESDFSAAGYLVYRSDQIMDVSEHNQSTLVPFGQSIIVSIIIHITYIVGVIIKLFK